MAAHFALGVSAGLTSVNGVEGEVYATLPGRLAHIAMDYAECFTRTDARGRPWLCIPIAVVMSHFAILDRYFLSEIPRLPSDLNGPQRPIGASLREVDDLDQLARDLDELPNEDEPWPPQYT